MDPRYSHYENGTASYVHDLINACRGSNPLCQVRQVKYLNNLVEQDHSAIKRRTRPMLNFQSVHSVRNILAGIELMHLIRKVQCVMEGYKAMSFAD